MRIVAAAVFLWRYFVKERHNEVLLSPIYRSIPGALRLHVPLQLNRQLRSRTGARISPANAASNAQTLPRRTIQFRCRPRNHQLVHVTSQFPFHRSLPGSAAFATARESQARPEQEIVALYPSGHSPRPHREGSWHKRRRCTKRPLLRPRHCRGKDHIDCGVILAQLGAIKYAMRQYEQSAALYRESRRILLLHLPRDNPQVTLVVNELALALSEMRQYEEAAMLNAENQKVREASLGKKHPATLLSLHNVGMEYAHMHRWPETVEALEKWLETDETFLKNPTYELSLEYIGDGQVALHHWDRAEKYFARELASMEAQAKQDHIGEARVIRKLFQVCGLQGKDGRAAVLRYGEHYLKKCKEQFGPERPEMIMALGEVGVNYCAFGMYSETAKTLRDSIRVAKKASPMDVGDYWYPALQLARADFQLQEFDEAESLAWAVLLPHWRLGWTNCSRSIILTFVAALLGDVGSRGGQREKVDEHVQKFIAGVESAIRTGRSYAGASSLPGWRNVPSIEII